MTALLVFLSFVATMCLTAFILYHRLEELEPRTEEDSE